MIFPAISIPANFLLQMSLAHSVEIFGFYFSSNSNSLKISWFFLFFQNIREINLFGLDFHCFHEIVSSTAQCGKFSTFLSLTFYVKSILENVNVQQMPYLQFQSLGIFDLGTFQPSENAKIHEKSEIRVSKCVKMAVFGTS